jgi:hypothetical protein
VAKRTLCAEILMSELDQLLIVGATMAYANTAIKMQPKAIHFVLLLGVFKTAVSWPLVSAIFICIPEIFEQSKLSRCNNQKGLKKIKYCHYSIKYSIT